MALVAILRLRPRVLAFHLRAWDEGITYPTAMSLYVPVQKPEGEQSVSHARLSCTAGMRQVIVTVISSLHEMALWNKPVPDTIIYRRPGLLYRILSSSQSSPLVYCRPSMLHVHSTRDVSCKIVNRPSAEFMFELMFAWPCVADT